MACFYLYYYQRYFTTANLTHAVSLGWVFILYNIFYTILQQASRAVRCIRVCHTIHARQYYILSCRTIKKKVMDCSRFVNFETIFSLRRVQYCWKLNFIYRSVYIENRTYLGRYTCPRAMQISRSRVW